MHETVLHVIPLGEYSRPTVDCWSPADGNLLVMQIDASSVVDSDTDA